MDQKGGFLRAGNPELSLLLDRDAGEVQGNDDSNRESNLDADQDPADLVKPVPMARGKDAELLHHDGDLEKRKADSVEDAGKVDELVGD